MDGEVLAEEVDGGLHLLAGGLADGAAELPVGAPRLDVDERDGHAPSVYSPSTRRGSGWPVSTPSLGGAARR